MATDETKESRMDALSIQTMEGGNALLTLNEAIENAAQDVIDRPDVKKARTVSLTITVTPSESETYGALMVELGWSVKQAVPGISGLRGIGFLEGDKIMIPRSRPAEQQELPLADKVVNFGKPNKEE